MQTLCLEVTQHYPQIDGAFSQPIAEAVESILNGLHIQVVEGDAPCDATLSFDLTLQALGREYQGDYYRYTGAQVEGQMMLTSPGHAPFSVPVNREAPTTAGIMVKDDSPKEGRPEDAQFHRAYLPALLDSMTDLWGVHVLTKALAPSGRLGNAASTLLNQREQDAIPLLIQALIADETPSVRQGAARSLGFKGTDAVPALIQALEDDDPGVRREAAEALEHITGESFGKSASRWRQWLAIPATATPSLAQGLTAESPSARKRAAKALGEMGPEAAEAVPALVRIIEDESEHKDVRIAAAWALGKIGPGAAEAVPALAQALQESDEYMHEVAVRALGGIGPEVTGVVPTLVQALGHWNAKASGAAVYVLKEMGVASVSDLIQALEDTDEDIRVDAARVLGQIGPQAVDAVPALIQTLEDPVAGFYAYHALKAITERDLGEDASEWQQWWQAQPLGGGQEVVTSASPTPESATPTPTPIPSTLTNTPIPADTATPTMAATATRIPERITVAERVSFSADSPVLDVAFSPDGRILAAAGKDDTVKLWDSVTGQELQTLTGHTDNVLSVDFSPDGKTLVSSGDDDTVRLWDVTTGTMLQTLKEHDLWVSSVVFAPDGKTFASGSADRTVKLWDAATGQVLHTFDGHTDWVDSVAFSPNGDMLVSGSCALVDTQDSSKCLLGEIILWDVATKQKMETFNNQTGRVRSVAFSPDGKILASGSQDGTISLWNVATRRPLNTLKGHNNWVNSVFFSSDGKILASGSDDHTVKLWDVTTGQTLNTLDAHTEWVNSVAFAPDGQTLASGSADGAVKLWDISTP